MSSSVTPDLQAERLGPQNNVKTFLTIREEDWNKVHVVIDQQSADMEWVSQDQN